MMSVIITSFKEPHTIGRAILAVLNQNISAPYEILVIAPDKDTLEAANVFARKHKHIRVLADPGKGKPTALNIAFRKIRGDIVVLTDGDVYMGKNAISLLISHFADNRAGAVTGRVVSANKSNTMLNYWALLGAETFHRLRLRESHARQNVLCSGYLYAVRASLVQDIPVDTLADDAFITHCIWQKQARTIYEPQALVYVHYPTTLIDWIKQKKRTAARFYQLNKRIGVSKVSSLMNEISIGVFSLRMIKKPQHLAWFIFLIVMRAYIWARVMFDRRLWGRSFKRAWERVESSKR
ncbi:MAG: glycosyltransferase [Nanoarchaeota archaeon]